MNEREADIKQALRDIEEQKQVRILYACESGSRAWGFASHDSDYDVRFLYVHRKEVYLRLDTPRDVIERPVIADLDINGWDIYKALQLLRKSNPPLMEWLFSPIIYLENSPAIEELRLIGRRFYSSTAVFYHYSRMAKGNYQQYMQGKDEVILKKYLYVLRPLIALLFVEQQQHFPPTNFLATLEQVQIATEVRDSISELIARKLKGDELGTGEPDQLLNAFIETHLKKWGDGPKDSTNQKLLTQDLDRVLLTILTEEK